MTQKIIKVGNSYALTIPSFFVKEAGLEAGDLMHIQLNADQAKLTITKADIKQPDTPEVKEWLESFNKKYKKGLTELAKK